MRTVILTSAAVLTSAHLSDIVQILFWFVLGASIYMDFVEFCHAN